MKNINEHSIRELALQFINQSGKQQLFAERTILQKWPEYIGKLCAGQTECVSINRGVLKVKVKNAALRFELTGRKTMIMEKINADYPTPVVKDILFF
jgi:predicted nucleic acid-binding Zn ribbon protein